MDVPFAGWGVHCRMERGFLSFFLSFLISSLDCRFEFGFGLVDLWDGFSRTWEMGDGSFSFSFPFLPLYLLDSC